MTRTLLVEVVSPEANLYKGEVNMVVAPTTGGEIGILPLHAPIVAELAAGELRLKKGASNDEVEVFSVFGGYLQCAEDRIVVLADLAINAKSCNISKLEEELAAAKVRFDDTPVDSVDERAAIEREIAWISGTIKVASRHQRC